MGCFQKAQPIRSLGVAFYEHYNTRHLYSAQVPMPEFHGCTFSANQHAIWRTYCEFNTHCKRRMRKLSRVPYQGAAILLTKYTHIKPWDAPKWINVRLGFPYAHRLRWGLRVAFAVRSDCILAWLFFVCTNSNLRIHSTRDAKNGGNKPFVGWIRYVVQLETDFKISPNSNIYNSKFKQQP